MSSLRYTVDERGHMRPSPKGEFVLFDEWEKAIASRDIARDNALALAAKVTELKIELAILEGEKTL